MKKFGNLILYPKLLNTTLQGTWLVFADILEMMEVYVERIQFMFSAG